MSEKNEVIEGLAEEVTQRIWVKLGPKIAALADLLTDRLNDFSQRAELSSSLLETMQHELAYCKSELDAIRAENTRSRHDQVSAITAMQQWRDLAQRREVQVTALKKDIDEYQRRIHDLGHGDD